MNSDSISRTPLPQTLRPILPQLVNCSIPHSLTVAFSLNPSRLQRVAPYSRWSRCYQEEFRENDNTFARTQSLAAADFTVGISNKSTACAELDAGNCRAKIVTETFDFVVVLKS